MKKFYLLFLLPLMFLISCSEEKEPEVHLIEKVSEALLSDNWEIHEFTKADMDLTFSFSAYSFAFYPNGNIVANDGSESFTGTFSLRSLTSGEDDLARLNLNIYFNLTHDLTEMNGDWGFVSWSEEKIELFRIKGGMEYLTFTQK